MHPDVDLVRTRPPILDAPPEVVGAMLRETVASIRSSSRHATGSQPEPNRRAEGRSPRRAGVCAKLAREPVQKRRQLIALTRDYLDVPEAELAEPGAAEATAGLTGRLV